MKNLKSHWVGLFVFTLLTSCGKITTLDSVSSLISNNNGSNSNVSNGSYQIVDQALNSQAMTLIQSKCNSCHSSTSIGYGGYKSSESLDLMIRDVMIIPGNSASSRVYIRSIDNTMPPGAPLTAAEKDTIKRWIDTAIQPVKGVPSPTPTSVMLMPTFASIQKNILTPKCVFCHGPTIARSGVRYDTYQATLRTVRAGSPNQSSLYTDCARGSMPPNPTPKLNTAELKALSDWIIGGALNN